MGVVRPKHSLPSRSKIEVGAKKIYARRLTTQIHFSNPFTRIRADSSRRTLFSDRRFQIVDLLAQTFGKSFDLSLRASGRAKSLAKLIVAELPDNSGEPSGVLDRY